jgi:hypothetical protein
MTLTEKIAELRVLMERATPLPWVCGVIHPDTATSPIHSPVGIWAYPSGPRFVPSGERSTGIHGDDALFIAAMRNHLPEILARMDALEAVADAARFLAMSGTKELSDAFDRLDGVK